MPLKWVKSRPDAAARSTNHSPADTADAVSCGGAGDEARLQAAQTAAATTNATPIPVRTPSEVRACQDISLREAEIGVIMSLLHFTPRCARRLATPFMTSVQLRTGIKDALWIDCTGRSISRWFPPDDGPSSIRPSAA